MTNQNNYSTAPYSDLVARKALILMGSIFFALSFIIVRLAYLQLIMGEDLLTQSNRNFTRTHTVASLRGSIVDRNFNHLATNRPINTIFWQGTGNRHLTPEQQNAIQHIATILTPDLSSALSESLLNSLKNPERRSMRIAIAKDISFEQLSKIIEVYPNHANLIVDTQTERFYPYGELASHLIGYLGSPHLEASGKMGLEKVLETALKGNTGLTQTTINSLGKSLSSNQLTQALHGETIQTTIDLPLQQLAEYVFPPEYAGSLIFMDPATGAIRALVSRPSFNPSIFLKPLSHEQWHELIQERQPFLNRALNAAYPPASLFKLITMTAAIEEGICTPETTWKCTGSLMYAGRKHWCNKRSGHGIVTAKQALAQSCNIPFWYIAQELTIDTLSRYAQRFGLGQPTGIMLPEQIGLMPTNAWKRSTKNEPWWPGETLSAAIGQSYLLATPLQMVRMISAIMQGYLVKPRIVENEAIIQDELEIHPDTREFLKQSMRMVVTTGTGKNINTIDHLTVYAKTGTAQTSNLGKQHLGTQFMEHTWFACWFHYDDDPPLAIVAMLEHTGSNGAAKTLIKRVLMEYKKLRQKIN